MERVNIAFRYISYKLFARHKKGHGVHSPFVFGFIKNVLANKKSNQVIDIIENKRKAYLRSGKFIKIVDPGAGSRISTNNVRTLKSIVKTSSIKGKYGCMLYRLAEYYQPDAVIELGTSAGISTMYLAASNHETKVYTVEANVNIAEVARETFQELNFKNIELIIDVFDDTLPELLEKVGGKIMLFIDGNHNRKSILRYFHWCIESRKEFLIVFDDINWSNGMYGAWKRICSDSGARITIDLFYMGIVLLNIKFLKQNFVIKF